MTGSNKFLATFALLGLSISFLTACGSDDGAPKVSGEYGATPTISAGKGDAPKKLLSKVLKEGTGSACGEDATVNVAYKGQLWNGKQFDSSYERGETTIFPLSGVVEGWREGLKNAKPGSRMELVIPPDKGYGDQAQANIPAKSTLVFVVDVYQCVSAKTGIEQLKKATSTGQQAKGLTISGDLGKKPTLQVDQDKLPKQTELIEIARGSGEKITADSTVIFHLSGTDKASGETKTTWDGQSPQTVEIKQAQPNLDTLVGKTVGSRIAGTVVVGQAPGGEAAGKVPAAEPTVVVMDIIGVLKPVKTKK